MKIVLAVGLLLLSSASFAGPRVVKNGGDIYAIEFLGIGQQLVKTMPSFANVIKLDIKRVTQAVDETLVESTSQPLYLNKVEKDAFNYPEKKYILFNRLAWAGRGNLTSKGVLVLHEYLGIAGISDTKYEISTKIIDQMGYGKVSYDGQVFDRKLTKAELQKLLPGYVSFISAQAKNIPSPADRSQMNYVSMGLDKTTVSVVNSSGVIGQQTRSIQAIKEDAQSSVNDLLAISESDRVSSTQKVLDGFNSAEAKVTCELGFSSISRMNDERIVKCEDNRSISPIGDGEGFGDVRTIILSIDGKTLAPIGVISVESLQAG